MLDLSYLHVLNPELFDFSVELQFVLFGFLNNIFSGKKYRASPEGVSLMDETNNIFSGKKYRASPEGVSLMDETNNIFSGNNIAPEIQTFHALRGLNGGQFLILFVWIFLF